LYSLQIIHNALALVLENVINGSGKNDPWVSCKHLYYVSKYLCKVDYATNNFIHAPTFSYNEVMHLLELAGVVEQA
jgi:hypothetical protein